MDEMIFSIETEDGVSVRVKESEMEEFKKSQEIQKKLREQNQEAEVPKEFIKEKSKRLRELNGESTENKKLDFVKPPKDTVTLRFLYNTIVGRVILKLLTAPVLSKICGAFLSCSLSKPFIKPFLKNNNIDTSEYFCDDFKCFNDCFSRKIRPGKREIVADANSFVSPCDGLLSVYKIDENLRFVIKNTDYSVKSLLQDDNLSKKYNNGLCLVFRLCVNHYHRYAYAESGNIIAYKKIKGKLHTVRPIALEKSPVFCENSREYIVTETENIGDILQMEVGAMLVGRIKNYQTDGTVKRGEEKGMFLYGGSTIVLLIEEDKVNIPKQIFTATEQGMELPVKLGSKIGSVM